jgi:hypothetical protein
VLSANGYYASDVWRYGRTGSAAANYDLNAGTHKWFVAPSGTAGNAITFTQAMTLDANGNLNLGPGGASGKLTVRNDSTTAQPFIDIVNRAVSSTFNMGGIRFSAYRDVADPSYIGALYCEADAPLGNVGNVWVSAGQNGTSSLPPKRFGTLSNGDFIVIGSYAEKASGTTWANPSDQRLKDNIRDYPKGLDELLQVRVREWEFNGKGGTTQGMKGLGVIADEIMTVLPDTVSISDSSIRQEDPELTDIKKFDATEITWLLVKAVQELKAEVDSLRAQLNP